MPKRERLIVCSENLSLEYLPHFFSKNEADFYFQTLLQRISWQEETIAILGKRVSVPRLISWYGDEEAIYHYSGVRHEPQKWTDHLLEIKTVLQERLGIQFNSVLANLYRNGQDSMGWHADNEPELGENPAIASVSLGAVRQFCLRHKKQKTVLQISLGHGSVLVMQGETQHYWKHALPKMKGIDEPRINLTFRRILGSQ
ncbi:alpha-ketoglutarate-dependent dioxygenase AlkB family protein [Legionella micdadei]|uniref:Alkylated DNA repair dioxygenase AlkB n=1 Tax=Legionella micdadei TaxID=451 RepID=A0A098GFX6_LEGMI|nr:alpha-ketoglutarate-dependent dioxygenase AlkB [Legionella micdadei]KTD29221.1 hypothetical protein Lmic_1141 [Legionella micdadei]NSL17406.1 alpha-ketoglutarate-dependent dioxygenase AlkB [Legionella micdadei]CEG61373.1 DNA repair system specific for alkylated DNA [Legionella micdadei]SCY39324.1 Alkylated DNA repair dioxygenase AlkB [Legionella micdadei]